jgi:hypothetical protein
MEVLSAACKLFDAKVGTELLAFIDIAIAKFVQVYTVCGWLHMLLISCCIMFCCGTSKAKAFLVIQKTVVGLDIYQYQKKLIYLSVFRK